MILLLFIFWYGEFNTLPLYRISGTISYTLFHAANERWIEWFGSMEAGVFNYDCMSTRGHDHQHCKDEGQRKAPLASTNPTEYCALVEPDPEDPYTLDCYPVILQGYDVVEYFNAVEESCDESVMGMSNFTYNMESADENGDLRVYQFWFSSESNRKKFSADPWKYAPKLGGFNAHGVMSEFESNGYPWAATHMGPSVGPMCYYKVYNNDLYLNSGASQRKSMFDGDDAEANVAVAEERWISWFGSLESGVFNFDCMTSGDGWSKCKEHAQPRAPLASSTDIHGSCGAIPQPLTTY